MAVLHQALQRQRRFGPLIAEPDPPLVDQQRSGEPTAGVVVGVDPHLQVVSQGNIDPEIYTTAQSINDQINAILDSLDYEYSSTIYRDEDGSIRNTPLVRGLEGQNSAADSPPGAEIVGYVHNHPIATVMRYAAARPDYGSAERNYYVNNVATAPSDTDMGALPFWRAHGAAVSPNANVYIGGPDGVLRTYGPGTVGYPARPNSCRQ